MLKYGWLKKLVWCSCFSYISVTNAKTLHDNWIKFTLLTNAEVEALNSTSENPMYKIPYGPRELTDLSFTISNFYIDDNQPKNVGTPLFGERAGEKSNTELNEMSMNVEAGRHGSEDVVASVFGNPKGTLLKSHNTTFGQYPDNLNFALTGELNFKIADEGTNHDKTASYTCNNIMLGEGSNIGIENWWFGGNNSYWLGNTPIWLFKKGNEAVVSLCSRTDSDNKHSVKIPVIFFRGTIDPTGLFFGLNTGYNQVKFYPGFNEFCSNNQEDNLIVPLMQKVLSTNEKFLQLYAVVKNDLIEAQNKLYASKVCTSNLIHNQSVKALTDIVAKEFGLSNEQRAKFEEILNAKLCSGTEPDMLLQNIIKSLIETVANAYCDNKSTI